MTEPQSQPQHTPTASDWSAGVRGLLLDIDDTLVDTQAAMRSSCASGAAAAWPHESSEVHTSISDLFYDDPGGYFDRYTLGEFPFAQMRAARYHQACRRLGLAEKGFEPFEAAYREAFAACQHLFDDVPGMLAAAESRGVQVAFVTNSGQEQTEIKMAAVGLHGPVVTTDTLGVGKPDPGIFTRAMELVGTAREQTLVVGDTLPTDVVGGRAAGLRVAWLQRTAVPEPRNAGWGTPLSALDDPGIRIIHGLGDLTEWFTQA